MKLIHEDSENYHLQHPSGRTMVVSKAGMSPEAHTLVHKFTAAHFDRGGQPQPSPTPSDPFQALANSHVTPSTIAAGASSTGLANGGEPPQHSADPAVYNTPAPNTAPPPPARGGYYNPDAGKQVMSPQEIERAKEETGTFYAKGGDVYNHQTKDYPNPKLAQVPEKDRMPGQIVQHFHFGGQTPQNFADGTTPASFMQPPPPQAPDNYVATGPTPNSPGVPAAPTGGPAPQAPPPATPPNPNAMPTDLMQTGWNSEQAAESAETKLGQAEADKSKSEAAAYNQMQQPLDTQSALMEENIKNYHQAWDKIANNTDPTIDPGHYWNSKSTPNAILSAVGFMLGGAGVGVAGRPELALQAINGAVDRDIEAQKATFANKSNLLGQYTSQFQSTVMGENALRLQYGAQTENLINRAAAQAGTPIAIQTAALAKQQLRQQSMGALVNNAQGQTAIDYAALKRHAVQDLTNPAQQQTTPGPQAQSPVNDQKFNEYQVSGMMPPEDVKAATTEAAATGEVAKLRQDFNQNFDDLNGKVLKGILQPGDRASAIWTLAGKIQHASANRFNLEAAEKEADAMLPYPGDAKTTTDNKRRRSNELFDTFPGGSPDTTPTLQRYNLLNKTGAQTPEPGAQNLVRRLVRGKVGLFDPATKKFVRYE